MPDRQRGRWRDQGRIGLAIEKTQADAPIPAPEKPEREPSLVIDIAIVEDDPLVREDLANLLAEHKELRCTGRFASGEEALAAIPQRPPRVVLMDINLTGMTGIECTRRLKEQLPDLLIIMLTIFDDAERVFAALRAGASGYLVKRSVPTELIAAIRQVVEGGSPMSPHIARRVVECFRTQRPEPDETDTLTDRERELLALLARGKHYKEIADHLGISTDTVRSHIRRIYRKLQVHSRTEATVKFLSRQQS